MQIFVKFLQMSKSFGKTMDKMKPGCYNPFYKQTKEVMCWKCDGTGTAVTSDGGSSDGFPKDEDQ